MNNFFNEVGLCITFTESAESIIEARDLSSQWVAGEFDGWPLVILRHVVRTHKWTRRWR